MKNEQVQTNETTGSAQGANTAVETIFNKNSGIVAQFVARGYAAKGIGSSLQLSKNNTAAQKESGAPARDVFTVTQNEISHAGNTVMLSLFDGDASELAENFDGIASAQQTQIAEAVKNLKS